MRIFGAAGDYVQHGQVDSFEASLHGTKDMNSKEEVDRVDELMKKQFSEADLRLLQSLEYKTKFAVKQLARLTAQRAGLDDFMMNIALTESLRLNDVMKKHAGDPSGIEFKQKSRDVWAVVLQDASVQGSWRVQYLDRDGMISHFGTVDLQAAVEEMLSQGYVMADQGAADTLCQTERWNRGVAIAGLMQQLNSGKITHDEYMKMAAQPSI